MSIFARSNNLKVIIEYEINMKYQVKIYVCRREKKSKNCTFFTTEVYYKEQATHDPWVILQRPARQ